MSFYITLASNLANFKADLPKQLSLPGTWEVGVSEISYPRSWPTLQTNENIKMYYYDETDENLYKTSDEPTAVVPFGNYKIEELIDLINTAIEKHFFIIKGAFKHGEFLSDRTVEVNYIPKVKFNNNIVSVETAGIWHKNSLVFIGLSETLCELLSIDYNDYTESITTRFKALKNLLSTETDVEKLTDAVKKLRAPYTAVFKGFKKISNFNVVSDICSNRIVNSEFQKLLRIVDVPDNAKYGDQVTLTYIIPEYARLSTKSLDAIPISIKVGDMFLNFSFGQMYITLHFRLIPDLIDYVNSETLDESPPVEETIRVTEDIETQT